MVATFSTTSQLVTHPGRFHVWRWEGQLAQFYGEIPCLFVDDNVGWFAFAQNRAEWREKEKCFAQDDS